MHASADPLFSSSSPSPGCSLRYLNTSAEELLKDNGKFDVVCSMEVIEHVDNPATFLATCAELVKVSPSVMIMLPTFDCGLIQPGGHLFLSTIARTPFAYLLTIIAAEYILGQVARGTHTYSKFINPAELTAFFQKYSSPSGVGGNGSTWITDTYTGGLPRRTEAEVRGLIYKPWSGEWVIMPRSATQFGAAECNYMFWVRKPLRTL